MKRFLRVLVVLASIGAAVWLFLKPAAAAMAASRLMTWPQWRRR